MMVRILSLLPMLCGLLCALIVVLSLFGYQAPTTSSEVPIVPCSDGDEGCNVAMNLEDMEVPTAFALLDITLEIEWKEPERGWLGVVDASAAEECPPDSSTRLTSCTEEEISKYLVVGGPDNGGLMTFSLEPGEYRFITGGYEGSGLSMQDVDMDASIHLDNYVEIVLAATAALLLLGAGEMAFPVRNLLSRFSR